MTPAAGPPPAAAGPVRSAPAGPMSPSASTSPRDAGGDQTRPALTITVHGPPAPQGSKHATLHKQSGRVVTMEASKRVRPWREAVKEAALRALDAASLPSYATLGQLRMLGPVHVEVVFCFDKPKSAPKRRRTWPITRTSGDVDKLQRSTFDALTDAGVYQDDSQVIDVHARKVFTDDPDAPLHVPGAVIRVWEVV
jgi:Holliday junction resolvase RusA-like endonuclease